MIEEKLIYHYTSFDKFKCILEHGTLRFKESTKSNDIVDTTLLFDVLKKYEGKKDFRETVEAARKFMVGYYQEYAAQNQHISLVACFTKDGDSRLLWDAYTMNRPSNIECKHGENRYCYDSNIKYNGVCIAFNTEKLEETIKKYVGDTCEQAYLFPIIYGKEQAREQLNCWFGEACEQVQELSKDPDQSQDIIKPMRIIGLTGRPLADIDLRKCLVLPMQELIGKIDAFSPFFKHEFWSDEDEVRASLCFHKNKVPGQVKTMDGYMYFDMPITSECIDHIILGPEFSDDDSKKIISHTDYKLKFDSFDRKPSVGKGVIRSK
jgi:hypothetical protein